MSASGFDKHAPRFSARAIARNRNSARRIAADANITNTIPPGAVGVESVQKPSEDEVRQRIAAFKARKPVTTPSRDDFHFDPNEPLRLITRERPEPDK